MVIRGKYFSSKSLRKSKTETIRKGDTHKGSLQLPSRLPEGWIHVLTRNQPRCGKELDGSFGCWCIV